MHKSMILSAMLLALCSTAYAASPNEQTIELKDGTTLILQADGKMRHLDREGRPLRMAEGKEMEGKDGAKYLMKNNVIWKEYWLKGTMNPNR